MIYCIDERHGTPCPADCAGCSSPDDGCDPTTRVEAGSQTEAARLAGWSEEYIESVADMMDPPLGYPPYDECGWPNYAACETCGRNPGLERPPVGETCHQYPPEGVTA
jgi:hypothetical protein